MVLIELIKKVFIAWRERRWPRTTVLGILHIHSLLIPSSKLRGNPKGVTGIGTIINRQKGHAPSVTHNRISSWLLATISPQWLHCMTRACGWPMMMVERRKGYQPAACFSKSKTTACPDFSAKSNAVNPFESWTMWEAPDAKSTSTFWACPYSDEMWSAVLLSARCPHWAFTLAPALIRRGKHLEFCVIAAAWIGARPHESTLSMRSRWSCSKSTNRSSLSHRAAWRGRRAMIVGLWGSIKCVSSRKSAHLMQQPSGKVLTLRGAIHCSNGDGYCGPGHIRATLKPLTQIANHCDWILKTNCTWACKQTVWQLWVVVATSLHLFTIVVILCSFASPIRSDSVSHPYQQENQNNVG